MSRRAIPAGSRALGVIHDLRIHFTCSKVLVHNLVPSFPKNSIPLSRDFSIQVSVAIQKNIFFSRM